jgi:hypothetical protein
MPAANVETREATQEPTVADRIADTVRRAAHVSHEARLMRSLARDVGEEACTRQSARSSGRDGVAPTRSRTLKRRPRTT